MEEQQPGAAPRKTGARARKWVILVSVVALLEAATVALVYWAERTSLRRDQFKTFMREGPWSDRYEYVAEGIKQPPTRAAGEAGLLDDEEVIGIVAGGHARAYLLAAMLGREQHVVNDLVGDRPISVTYCDVAECIRAYAAAPGHAPIDVAQGGLKGQRMVLRVDGSFYLQDTGEPLDPNAQAASLPYEAYPAARTTWRAWRQSHPETDVYTGLPDAAR